MPPPVPPVIVVLGIAAIIFLMFLFAISFPSGKKKYYKDSFAVTLMVLYAIALVLTGVLILSELRT